jgi:imidazolonepropionase-like amidohydrolase
MKPMLFVYALTCFAFAQQPVTVIRGGMVIDGTGAAPRAATVVIRGGRIEAVGSDLPAPAGARIIDATGKTIVPGFFDLHTHLTASPVSGMAADWGRNAAAYLAAGVTSINDFAEYSEMYPPMRALLASQIAGPHVHFAARLSTPGGHGTEGGWGDFVTLTASTPAEGKARIRTALAGHPDVIKIFTDGWRYGTAPDLTSINLATLTAMVEEAHAGKVKVFTHTVTLAGAKMASRAGVDVLAHGVGDAPVDNELIALMKEHGTFYVPTLSVFQLHDPKALHPLAALLMSPLAWEAVGNLKSPNETEAHAARWANLRDSVRRLHEAGVPAAIGTDAGMPGTYHGYATLNEMERFVDAGLKPLEAIAAGTSVSARALGIDSERGVIAPGMFADLVILDGHPDQNIGDIEKAVEVFRDGAEIDLASLKASIASAGATRIPLRPVAAGVDDMERLDGRTSLGTLRVNSTDSGSDHSQMLYLPEARGVGDHALMIVAKLSSKPDPWVRMEFPLTPGAVEPGDASAFSGVSFEARGNGVFRLLAYKSSARNPTYLEAAFKAGDEWTTIRIPLADLKSTPVHALAFELAGAADSSVWLELDNVRFY